MNRRRSFLPVLMLTATAALTLSACGSDDGTAKRDEKTQRADEGSDQPVSPDSSVAAGRPRIKLPEDLTLVFEGSGTEGPEQDAVLADNAERMRAVDAAIAAADPGSEALGFYNTGKALEAAVSWVGQFQEANATVTGEVRYFDRRVTLKDESSAALTFCADESKGFSKDRKTGKVAKTPVTQNSYVLYDTRLDRNTDGVWQTSQIVSTRGATQCQP
ncbi:hypothetical protein KVH15_02945 [Streptomyces olivaceus]|nr:hypothetical protein [Streptomyces olivaceus]